LYELPWPELHGVVESGFVVYIFLLPFSAATMHMSSRSNHQRRLLIILLMLCASVTEQGVAQQLPFHTLSVRDGLLSNYIMCFNQDTKGRLLIGTPEGVSVFDGVHFTNYTSRQGLSAGSVTSIREDPTHRGSVLIGTTRGLYLLRHGRIRQVPVSDPDAAWITDLAVDRDGTVWAGAGRGLFRYRNGTLEQAPVSGRARTVSRITTTPDGMVWILNHHGVHRYDPRRGMTRTIDSSSGYYPGSNAIMHDARGDVFVCARDSSILQFSGGVLKRKIRVADVLPMFVVQDNHGSYWVGTSNGLYACGTDVPDPARGVRYGKENGLPASALNLGFFDNENNLWFGTEGKGITRLEDRHIAMFTDVDLTGHGIFDNRGVLWLTSVDGIWEYRSAGAMRWTRTLHRATADWPGGYPYAIVVDAHGRLVVTFASACIALFDISGYTAEQSGLPGPTIIVPRGDLPAPDAFTLCADRKARLWCNLGKGRVGVVSIPDGRLLKMFTGIPHDIRKIYEDLYGRVWIGGYNSGITIIDANDLESASITRLPALEGISTRNFFMDRRGRMWIGTLFDGVIVVDKDTIIRYTERDTMLSDKVHSITEALDGTIWLGTQTGMAYAPKGSPPFRTDQELTDSPVYGCLVRNDGLLLICTRYQLSLVDLTMSTPDTIPPVVNITGMQANGRDIPIHAPVSLGANENNCRIEFTAVRLRRPASIRYQYKLEGASHRWSTPTRERSLSFAALRPGTYTVLVRAINGEGVVSRTPARLTFTINRPYWQQWWFILLTVSVIGLILFSVIRGRVRRLLEIERIRSRIAADLHDDIGSGLTRIALMTEVMQRQMHGLSRQERPDGGLVHEIAATMSRVGSISRELVEGMSDVVWSIDPRNDSLVRLIDRVRVYALDVCESRDVVFQLETMGDTQRFTTNSDLSRCVLLVSKEAINNAIRHSGASRISMTVQVDAGHIRMDIRDDGRGFDEALLSRINGLTNMRNRVEKAGGVLRIASSIGAGTSVSADIPLRD
jgi:ligand-binding sensor domain-containing protein/signal transduction histidine kinase